MNSLTLTLIRVAFLAVLWLFVIAAIGVVRTDLFGTSAAKLRKGRNRAPQRQQPPRPQKQSRPSRGTNRPARLPDVTVEDFDAIFALNVRAAFFVAQAVALRLIEAKLPGSIINISSQMGHVGAAR